MADPIVSFSFKVNKNMFKDLKRDVDNELAKAMIIIRKRLRRYARENINAGGGHRYENDTGVLKRATGYRTIKRANSLKVEIFVDLKKAPYGEYIINGKAWKNNTPDAFLDKTLNDNEAWIKQTINKAIHNATVKFNRRR